MKPISRAEFRSAIQTAFSETETSFRHQYGTLVSLMEMNDLLCARWKNDWCSISARMPPDGGWDWKKIHERTHYSRDEFTIAISDQKEALCGLVMLKVVKTAVRVVVLEGSPDETHSLKRMIIAITLDLALRVAKHLDREYVRLMEPAAGLIPIYENAFGYKLVRPSNDKPYCERRVP